MQKVIYTYIISSYFSTLICNLYHCNVLFIGYLCKKRWIWNWIWTWWSNKVRFKYYGNKWNIF